MSRSEVIRYIILRSIGNFLVLFAIFGVFATFGPALYYEAQYRIIQIRGVHFSVVAPTQQITTNKQQATRVSSGGFADILSGPKEQILTPIDPLFSILIPKVGASARVFPNVDPSSQNAFIPILQLGVAHAAGTFFPGQKGNIYLFAHSTDNFWNAGRYNAIFYLLKDLSKGDEMVVFYQNVRHNYMVTDSKIVDPSDVSYITNAQSGKAASAQGFGPLRQSFSEASEPRELLILQTCWPPGTTWQRLMVFAEPK